VLQQKSMGFVDVNARLFSGSTEDFGDANRNELSDQHVRYLAARGEIGARSWEKLL